MRIHRTLASTLILVTAAAASTPAPAADDPPAATVFEAVSEGTFSLDLRYRFENVSQDGFDDNGRASTLRTMAGYRTRWWRGLELYLEFEDVRDLGLENDHNNAGSGSLGNGVGDRPVIADPALTEINQAYLGIRPVETLRFRVGKQEIVIDNHRFVGNVLWRQNHQTFEAGRVDFTGVEGLELSYSYIGRQHTVTGASLPMSTSHLGAGYAFEGVGTLKAYSLLLDYRDDPRRSRNSVTYGAFFDGNATLSGTLDLGYRLEYARQDDRHNPDRIRADYLRADLGLTISKVTFGVGYEVLGGSPEDGQFNTPLATLHKFNGWADTFLVTPEHGLQDLFISVTAKLGRFKLLGIYHDFSADTGTASWGAELDAAVIFTAPWEQVFALKLADYSADEHAADTTKLWLWTSWGF